MKITPGYDDTFVAGLYHAAAGGASPVLLPTNEFAVGTVNYVLKLW